MARMPDDRSAGYPPRVHHGAYEIGIFPGDRLWVEVELTWVVCRASGDRHRYPVEGSTIIRMPADDEVTRPG